MVAFARQFINTDEDARDVVQEVFISIWRSFEKLDSSKNIRSYLFTATKNKCFDFLKKNKIFTSQTGELENRISENITSQDYLQASELRSIIYSEVKGLPNKCREIFLLSREEGLTYRKIADKLNISIKTVENQMIIALKRIRKCVHDYHEEGIDRPGQGKMNLRSLIFITNLLGVYGHSIVSITGLTL